MKQFKSVKVKKRKRIIKLIFTFFFFFAYVFMVKYCLRNKLKENVLEKDVNYVSFNLNKIVSSKMTNVINKPVSLLNNNVKRAVKTETKKAQMIKKNDKNKLEESLINKNIEEPIIYVYNTHQTEKYVDYSVYDAAFSLADKLNKSGVKTIFEEQSVSVFLEQNNLKYYKSYTVSRKYLEEALSKYLSLKYFIDVHRDSVSKEKSTITYKGKNYAKVLFVIGLDNVKYDENLKNTNRLNQIIENKVPGISRGIMKKSGKDVNGVYNQDVSDNLFLIEIGSNYNTKGEVENTVNIIYEALFEYVRGEV